MSTSVRLSLIGKRNHPLYRIVVSETRYKRDGKHVAILGIYNPNLKPPIFDLDRTELEKWIKKGARVSDGLRKLLLAAPSDERSEQGE